MKICPFCHTEIPDEAIYCLQCASIVNDRQVFLTKKEKAKKTLIAVFSRKTLLNIIAITLSLIIVISSTFIAIRFTKNDTTKTETTKSTSSTSRNNEIINNSHTLINDDNTTTNYDETTTKKQNFFDNLFNKNELETKYDESSDRHTETTTKKQGLLDKIFGNDEDEKTTSTTNKNNSATGNKNPTISTEPEATTKNEPTVETTTNKPETSSTTVEPFRPGASTTTTTNKAEVPTTITTTESTTLENTYSSDKDFQYEPYSDSTTKISLTKYTGNASYVTVPVYIDGLMVVEIQSDTFKDNNNIKTIDIPDDGRSYIWLRNNCFNNLSSFNTLNLYSNDIGMYGKFALYCPIKTINVTSWQYKFVDGALYQWNSKVWEFIHFAGNPCYSVLNLPDWCAGVEGGSNLMYADNLKVINVSKEVSYVPTSYNSYHNNLEEINVEAGSVKFYSKDGVLFYRSGSNVDFSGSIYPYSKKDKTFIMPTNSIGYTLSGTSGSKSTNIYIEELYIPSNCKLSRADYLSTYSTLFPNLKKIYIAEGHSQYKTIRQTFTGEMETY